LDDPSWRYDIRPEILDGKNVYDFVDPEIEALLEELEREEEEREAELEAQMEQGDGEEGLTEEQEELWQQIRNKKKLIIQAHRNNKTTGSNKPIVPRTHENKEVDDFEHHLKEMGIDAVKAVERARERSRSRSESRVGRKRTRSEGPGGEEGEKKKNRRSTSRSQTPGDGYSSEKHKTHAASLAKRSQKVMNKLARAGESDRKILTAMPKHLFSGKRGGGTTDRR
jgi:nucleolar GTP-binding protein